MTDRLFLEFLNLHFWAEDVSGLLSGLKAAQSGADRSVPFSFPFSAELPESGAERAAFEEDFERLFKGTDPCAALPLWESACRGGSQRLLDEHTVSVISRYADEHVKTADPSVPADYIGYETEFCLLLCDRYGTAGPAADFEKEHLAGFLRHVFFLAKERCRSAWFRGLSESVLKETEACAEDGIFRGDTVSLQHSPALGREQAQAAPASVEKKERAGEGIHKETCHSVNSLRPHFLPLSEGEAEKLTEVRYVRAAGIGNCGGKCALSVRTQAGCVTGMTPAPGTEAGSVQDVLRPCARGLAYPDTFLTTDRLRSPLLQTGERGSNNFRRISWKDAVRIMADKMRSAADRYGPGSRYVNYATGVSAVISPGRMAKRLLALDGGFLDYYNSYSTACLRTAVPFMYGTNMTGSSPDTLRKAEMLILWGFNPVVTMHNPELLDLLLFHRKKGTPVVVIDPHKSETAAAFGAQWVPVRPGTDGALAAAMARVIREEGLEDRAFLDGHCLGFDSRHMPAGYEQEESWTDYLDGLRDHTPKTPAWAAEVTGVPAETIRQLAVRYASAKPAAILTGWGPQRHANGEQTTRAIMVLPCMTGNVGVEGSSTGGGIWFPQHCEPEVPVPDNPYGRSIPSFLWTDAILRGTEMTEREDGVRGGRLDSNIRLIFNLAGNTLVNQHSDVNRTIRILQDRSRCECIIASDLFMTASARYADLVLPGTSLFEGEHMAAPWEMGNCLLYGNRSIPPLFDSRPEFEWLCALAEELGIGDLTEGCGSVREWNRLLYERVRPREPELPDFETFASAGGYLYKNNPSFTAFRAQREKPGEVPYPTASGKIEIFSPALAELGLPDVPPLPAYVPAFEGISDEKIRQYPLQLIGWHTKRRCHSIHDNNKKLEKLEPHRLWIHPEDAADRGLDDGDEAEVLNDRGKIRMKVHVTDRIRKGVICIPQGAWFTPAGDSTDMRGCVNVLTSARPTPLAKGNPQHSALAEVVRVPRGNGNQSHPVPAETVLDSRESGDQRHPEPSDIAGNCGAGG